MSCQLLYFAKNWLLFRIVRIMSWFTFLFTKGTKKKKKEKTTSSVKNVSFPSSRKKNFFVSTEPSAVFSHEWNLAPPLLSCHKIAPVLYLSSAERLASLSIKLRKSDRGSGRSVWNTNYAAFVLLRLISRFLCHQKWHQAPVCREQGGFNFVMNFLFSGTKGETHRSA